MALLPSDYLDLNASDLLSTDKGSEVVVWVYPIKESKTTFSCIVNSTLLREDGTLTHPQFGECFYWKFE
jgi:hypothetical protein